MSDATAEHDLLEAFRRLPPEARRSLADYARALTVQAGLPVPLPRGTPGRELLKFAGTLSPETADRMQRVIDEEFGHVNRESWALPD